MATTINRATWTDDDGSGMTGTIINNARLQGDVYDKVDGALATLDAKDTSQDAAIAANGPHSILSATHTDSVPAGLAAGDLLIANASAKLARLPKGADGRLLGMASGLPAWTPAAVGEWVPIPYNAANFFGTGTMTWTVEAADQAAFKYMLLTSPTGVVTAIISITVVNSTVGGTLSNTLIAVVPFTVKTDGYGSGRLVVGGTYELGFVQAQAAQTRLLITRQAAGLFLAGTNNNNLQATVICEVWPFSVV